MTSSESDNEGAREPPGIPGRVRGAKAVVTASGGGMGGNIALRLAEEGADVGPVKVPVWEITEDAFEFACAIQLGPYGINVNAVAPGGTRTNASNSSPRATPPFEDGFERGGTLGRPNEAVDIANAVLYLPSEESRQVSGHLLNVGAGANPRL